MPFPGLVTSRPERKRVSMVVGIWKTECLSREAICGSYDLPVKILPLSGNSNHLEKYTVNVIQDSSCN